MNKIIDMRPGALVPADQQDDPIAVIFGPANVTLKAARKVQPLVDTYKATLMSPHGVRTLRSKNLEQAMEDRKIALNYYRAIPPDLLMYQAQKLFRAAERESAPEPWLHAAIGLAYDALPNAKNISPTVRFGLVDSMLYDREVWDGYPPGFSAPVIVEVAREVRRTCQFAPGPAEFLKLCQKHRANFKELAIFSDDLIQLRQNAEDVLITTGDVMVQDDGWF